MTMPSPLSSAEVTLHNISPLLFPQPQFPGLSPKEAVLPASPSCCGAWRWRGMWATGERTAGNCRGDLDSTATAPSFPAPARSFQRTLPKPQQGWLREPNVVTRAHPTPLPRSL